MTMLAETRRRRHRCRHPQAHPHRGGGRRRHRRGVRSRSPWTTDPDGYGELVALADRHSGSAGVVDRRHRRLRRRPDPLTSPHGTSWSIELDRPNRPARRNGAKSDPLDAVRAGREALAREHLAQPRAAGERAALAVLLAARRSAVDAATDAQRQLHALVIAAPETLRARFRGQTTGPCSPPQPPAPPSTAGTSRPPPRRRAARPWPAAATPSGRGQRPREGHPGHRASPGGPTCSTSPASARSSPPPCCAPGPTPAAAATKPPSPTSPASHPSPPPPA